AFGFAQKADDLLVSKTFLHVQSPRGRELDSKLRRYSKLGGRRIYSSSDPWATMPSARCRSQDLPLCWRQARLLAKQAERHDL
ncbi:hypothetical protein LYZ82_23615, partial [Xanthomonas hortorum pv. hederae]|uniref:hypothetical protein n=1 Tax=Xanthomonas hortorum TaxID=56454 RepID=UPI001B85C1F5